MKPNPLRFALFALSILVAAIGSAPAPVLGAPSRDGPSPGLDAGRVIELPSPGNHQDIRPSLQAAVDAAAAGDTILLPAGEFYVDGRVVVNKFVSVVGRGRGATGTLLYRREEVSDETLGTSWKTIFEFRCYSDEPSLILISDIHFRGKRPSQVIGDGGSMAADYAVWMQRCVDFVIAHNTFEHFGHAAVSVYHRDTLARGLVVANTFLQNVKLDLDGTTTGYGVVLGGEDKVWVPAPKFGTDNFIFIEDNSFLEQRHAVAGAGGGLYVFRGNRVVDNLISHAVDAHGGGMWGNELSTRAVEIYDNRISNTRFTDGTPLTEPPPNGVCTDLAYAGIKLRGGEGLIYHNSVEGYRFGTILTTEITGTYPVNTQVGYSSGLELGPSHTGTSGEAASGDVFVWSNTYHRYDPSSCLNDFRNDSPSLLGEGRDYHLEVVKPGYTPYVYPHPLRRLIPSLIQTFEDVPLNHAYYDEIEALYQAGYTAGCATDPLRYCPDQAMNRAESAVFVERGVNGTDGLPPQPSSQTFADLPLDSWAAKWAEALWQDHYTAGCGTDPLVYCPWQGHTRAEGCVFYLHMLNGPDYAPPQPAQQTFADVPLEAWYAKWVQAAYDAGLITPCQTSPELRLCPSDPLSRGMAAYMMVQAKHLTPPTGPP